MDKHSFLFSEITYEIFCQLLLYTIYMYLCKFKKETMRISFEIICTTWQIMMPFGKENYRIYVISGDEQNVPSWFFNIVRSHALMARLWSRPDSPYFYRGD